MVAEIGQDVPDNVSCFQIVDGQEGCTTERHGATRIRITDIDRKMMVKVAILIIVVLSAAMIIGFTTRLTITSERDVPEGFDAFPIIGVSLSTLRTAEREHPLTIRFQETISNATVLPGGVAIDPYDAAFGTRPNNDPDEPIIQQETLGPLENSFAPLQVTIRDDFVPEPYECFSMAIDADDVIGRRELFMCNEDGTGATSFFCDHTVCIIDDDGEFESFNAFLS